MAYTVNTIGAYKIVCQDRRLASPPQGQKQAWTEYQVKEGRKVISRWDTQDQAEKDAQKRLDSIREKLGLAR